MNLKLNYVTASDRGLVRENNEDSAYAGPHLLVLADGMGGHAAGEVASQLMVSHMKHLDKDPGDADMLALLGAAAEDANASIEASVKENPEQDGMGTTLSALMFNGREVGLIHVGDSRGYLLRDATLTQITEDDTFVQSLVKEGRLDPGDVSSHPQKSLILKAYTGRPVEPHLETIPVQVGDRFMLCSDGLSDPVTSSTIEETLRHGEPDVVVQRLIELALRSGGPDNITIIVADVVDTDDPAAPHLPSQPAQAGALLPNAESTHPDSAASRAAALMRTAETPAPTNTKAQLVGDRQGANGASTSAHEPADDEESHRRRPAVWTFTALVLALAITGLGVYTWLNQRAEDEFTVAADTDGQITIQRIPGSVLGTSTPENYQLACISDKNELRIVSADTPPQDCTVFTIDDLPDAEKSAFTNFSPGAYEESIGLMNRLADAALPACVDEPENNPEEQPTDTAEEEPNDQDNKPEEQNTKPTNCRTVK
ncbi:PP2C family protein-serine/threonine phosphatase [Corynebacterium mayonis]|uniref:PP2C family protein-serine/threonine phosphatase n=1 Tax=Corynebacterium mayonis TaxID=3062461 RepID=UPI00314019ED